MNRYYYDFHVHSCLSPCADNDMTPNNIAGMAALAGLNIVALTDHNSARNCPAFFAAAKKQGIIPVAGMELTTAEDIHMVCLFEHLENALAFNDAVDTFRIRIPNRVDIFGEQLLTDE
ncbi:MAG: PHP domain-containing protein, partial [Clostridia bacterium]|nr:PHP domain-containing protein [Clostridia bacterium]